MPTVQLSANVVGIRIITDIIIRRTARIGSTDKHRHAEIATEQHEKGQ